MNRAAAAALSLAIAFLWPSQEARAQDYPARPVRIVVPFAAGGTVDLVARVLADDLTQQTGQTFVVENRSGASGAIGSDSVAKAPPDGYTLLIQTPTLIVNPLINRKVPYDAIRDFRPIAMIGSAPMVMTVHPSIPAKNLKEFVELARASQGKYALGISSVGSPMHLATEAIKKRGGFDIPSIPYRGTSGAINDALGGQIAGMIDAIPSSAPHIASGRLRALAVTTRQRARSLPNVPTVAESGYPEFDMATWYGIWAPRGLPDATARRLEALIRKAMASKRVADRLSPQSFEPNVLTGDLFSSFITKELATSSRIEKEAQIVAE
jgi:tripartite-type tricarboxylate transporter receptor subunit TctC